MNRTALTIRMLMILKARATKEPISTKELATILETNPRNIREYKKELETAGFVIKEKKGPYGGYILDEKSLFALPDLTPDEKEALKECSQFLQQHKDLAFYPLARSALDKILGQIKDLGTLAVSYVERPISQLDPIMVEMMEKVRQAIQLRLSIVLTYLGNKDKVPKEIVVDPYDIVHFRNSYYLVGFSHARNDYRVYRFSSKRFLKCEITSKAFLWDSQYQLFQVIGRFGLVRLDQHEVIVKVDRACKDRFEEYTGWGFDLQMIKEECDALEYRFLCTDRYELYRQIFSFDGLIKILEPQNYREEFAQKIRAWKEIGEIQ